MTLTDKTVIVVEDTYDDMQLVSAILKHAGVIVEVARNGQECLDLIRQKHPVMIVTDLAMPVMDGWEMLKHLRGNPDTEHIPVVAVTAYYSVDVAQDAIHAGFDAYFAKPISPLYFVDSIKDLVPE